ncbi:hypothetical protein F5051DRAFT_445235 [Lentinula edodes]|nr:hypothetical protein F5051DRAFT_445235 [Lentinula edodes]
MSLLRCQVPGCMRTFKRSSDLTRHVNLSHKHYGVDPFTPPDPQCPNSPEHDLFNDQQPYSPPPPPLPKERKNYHPFLHGDICTEDGRPLSASSSPPPQVESQNPWEPCSGEAQFCISNLLFKKVQMSQTNINELFNIWNLHQQELMKTDSPFENHKDMYTVIDSIVNGGAAWNCF